MNTKQTLRDYEVAAVKKALEILCEFSASSPSLAVSDLSRRLEIPKSTTHNLLRTLRRCDFLTQDPEDRRYRLGPRVFELGLLFSHNTRLVNLARAHLRRLADQTKETVKLGVLSDGDVLVLAAIESPFQLHTRGDEGRRAPAHCTGLGKAILSSLTDDEIREFAGTHGLAAVSAHTITSFGRLEQEVERIRADGYALDIEENEDGVRCAASAIQDASAGAAGAISISGPSSRISDERLREFAFLVRDAARQVSASLAEQAAKPARGRRTAAIATVGGKQ